jgi:hypothetical protein
MYLEKRGKKGVKLLLPGHADREHLAPVYARLYDVY